LFWEYATRTGRRWEPDPKPITALSVYSTFNNNPILNKDPEGDLFFNTFGSSSAQRKAAKDFAEIHGGEVKGILKRSVHVDYSEGYTDYDGAAGVEAKTQYFNNDGSNVNPNGEITEWKPSLTYNWSQSNNILAKATYSISDAFYVTGQNLFYKNTLGDGNAYHLGGGMTTPNENVTSFIDASSSFIPSAPETEGLAYFKKLNAAEFSKFFKGTIVTKLEPGMRGLLNRGVNMGIKKWNATISSGAVVRKLSDKLSHKMAEKPNEKEKK